ncbi:MAG: hypothetical protein ACREID_08635 [Planctomycetota bacterium]
MHDEELAAERERRLRLAGAGLRVLAAFVAVDLGWGAAGAAGTSVARLAVALPAIAALLWLGGEVAEGRRLSFAAAVLVLYGLFDVVRAGLEFGVFPNPATAATDAARLAALLLAFLFASWALWRALLED